MVPTAAVLRTTVALSLLTSGAWGAGESDYWDSIAAEDEVFEEDVDHIWPNRYWEALHGHARCIPDYYGHCVPMELMSRICEFNRQADLGAWDSLKMNMLRTHLELEHGLGEVHGVTLSKIDPAQATEGWNMMAQPTEENDSMPDGAVIPCEMAAQWCRYESSSCGKEDKLPAPAATEAASP